MPPASRSSSLSCQLCSAGLGKKALFLGPGKGWLLRRDCTLELLLGTPLCLLPLCPTTPTRCSVAAASPLAETPVRS